MIHKELYHANMEDLLNQVRRQKQTDDSNPEVYRERVMSAARRVLKDTNQDEISIEHKKGKVSFRLDRDTDKIRMILNGQEVSDDQLTDVIANLDEIGKPKSIPIKKKGIEVKAVSIQIGKLTSITFNR